MMSVSAIMARVERRARWALYRLSGRRLLRSPEHYRIEVPRFARHRPIGMTTPTELAYLKWHAQEVLRGRGEVVDLGCWFGSTTVALARGLAGNPRREARRRAVHAYDRFIWERWMDGYAAMASFGPYAPGDSFRREFELAVAPWREQIEVHEADLLQERWDLGEIELLVVDAMKSWELAEHVVRGFFGRLLPGEAHVVHQDFAHCYTPWIHLLTYRLRDHMRPAVDVEGSETVVFFVSGPVGEVVGDLPLGRDSFDDLEVQAAFAHSLAITRPEKHSSIHAARVMLHVYDGELFAARRHLRRLERRGQLSELDARSLRQAITEAASAAASDARSQ
jgi:hypothetical protein